MLRWGLVRPLPRERLPGVPYKSWVRCRDLRHCSVLRVCTEGKSDRVCRCDVLFEALTLRICTHDGRYAVLQVSLRPYLCLCWVVCRGCRGTRVARCPAALLISLFVYSAFIAIVLKRPLKRSHPRPFHTCSHLFTRSKPVVLRPFPHFHILTHTLHHFRAFLHPCHTFSRGSHLLSRSHARSTPVAVIRQTCFFTTMHTCCRTRCLFESSHREHVLVILATSISCLTFYLVVSVYPSLLFHTSLHLQIFENNLSYFSDFSPFPPFPRSSQH